LGEGEKTSKPASSLGKWGLWLAIIGGILILIDGALVLGYGTFYGPHYGGVAAVGWIEVSLGIIIIAIAPFYSKSPAGIGWTIFALAIITMAFDGGFWEAGAIIGLIGGIFIALKGK